MMKIDILRCIHFWKADVKYFQKKKKKLKIEKKALIGNLHFFFCMKGKFYTLAILNILFVPSFKRTVWVVLDKVAKYL